MVFVEENLNIEFYKNRIFYTKNIFILIYNKLKTKQMTLIMTYKNDLTIELSIYINWEKYCDKFLY